MISHVRGTLRSLSDIVVLDDTETVVPDPGRLIFALRQIGYRLEQALADLVDNSVSAGAGCVLIRFIWKKDRITSVAVVDDGGGMNESELRAAMRFGSADRLDPASLGKFGMGLKLASFSHARELVVASVRSGCCQARRWTLDSIRRNWECEVIEPASARLLIQAPWSPLDLGRSGTVVIWNDIDKLPVSALGIRATLRAVQRRLQIHLGLHFHRFLESGRLNILLDQQEEDRPEQGIRVRIEPLNPFRYPESPEAGYPRVFIARIPGVGSLELEGHIWPSNSERPEYRLDNRAAARQGFYFYRNNRLIQAGGWNGLIQNDSEPHSSLARIRVDLPPAYDAAFSLNVQKSSVVVPPTYVEAVQAAVDAEGNPFEHYRRTAQAVYRNEDRRAVGRTSPVAGSGLPASLRKEMSELLRQGAQPTRAVDFEWRSLPDEVLFDPDPENSRLILNEQYRDILRAEETFDADDLPVIKMLLLLLVRQDYRKPAIGITRKRELERINRLLVSAIGHRQIIDFED